MTETSPPSLVAPHRLAYTYKRSLGPVLSQFFSALRERRFLGVRRSDGSVLAPPREYDPDTAEALSALVPVSAAGVVKSWSWVAKPRAQQPLAHPFAYALVQLDGADNAFLHVVDAGEAEAMQTGMRVVARFVDEPQGAIDDFVFVPEAAAPAGSPGPEAGASAAPEAGAASQEPLELLRVPVELNYDYTAGRSASRFLRAIAEGKLLGQKCPVDGRVYFPSRGSCPQHGVPFGDEVVELSDKGTVVTYSIVRVPSENIPLELPYIAVQVLLDGADTILMHLLDCELDKVHMGMRVQAHWKPREQWDTSLANILYFRPLDEPDADYESYKEHI